MKHYDIIFPFLIIPVCVLLGSWFFESSFAITFSVILFGVIFGTIVEWKKFISNDKNSSNHSFLSPKHEVMVYGAIFVLTIIIIYKFPKIRDYGFF